MFATFGRFQDGQRYRWIAARRTLVLVVAAVGLLMPACALASLPGATPGPHQIDAPGIRFLTGDRYDKLSLVAYNDPVHCTIGYGYKVSDYPCQDPRAQKRLEEITRGGFTKEKAEQLLRQQLTEKTDCVNSDLKVPITQDQFDALVDFAYNVGCGAVARVIKFVNDGDLPGAASKVKEYNKGDVYKGKGKKRHKVLEVLGGLVMRRGAEAKLLDGQTTLAKLLGGGPPPTNDPCAAPNHGGGIDATLQGEFFGEVWGAGSVTATGGDLAPETASVGYDYVSEGHFGPWACGTTVTLAAMPTQGNHFDRWTSTDGSCETTSTTCTVHITTTTVGVLALFAPTTYTLSVTNQQPDGVVTSGGSGGYVDPPIDCGSQPNGPITMVYTQCSSPALAQRSEDDVTQLNVNADAPGPGGDFYGIASIDGCDRSVATSYELPGGGGTYVARVQCFIDMNSDRTVTVEYKDVGPPD